MLSCLCAAAVASQAQSPAVERDPDQPQEIIVTGERSSRSLRETASSAVAFTGRDLESLAAPDRTEQVLALVPNVQLGSGGEAPAIRGNDGTGVLRDLPAFLGGARPRVTLQVDGRPVSYNEFAFGVAPLWDVARVEVFRSPQTTTQGRNAIGGAIFVETEQPGFDAEAKARMIVGDARTRQGSFAVGAPLVTDQLAVRATGDFRRSRTSSDLSGPIDGVDLNADRVDLLRLKVRAEPKAVPGLRLDVTYAHTAAAMPQVEGIRPPFEERRDSTVNYGYFETDVDSITARVRYALSDAWNARTTISFGDAAIQRFAIAGFGETQISARDWTAESVVEWSPAAPIRLVAGVHRSLARLDQSIDLTAALLGVGTFEDAQRSTGVFGEATWLATERLTLTAGGRFQEDRQRRVGALQGRAIPLALDYRQTFRAFLPKFSLAYDVLDDWRLGLLVQRAYNPGGMSLDARGPDRFDPEYLWNFEVFTRAAIPSHAIELNANIFYNAIRDAQRRQLDILQTPGGPVTFFQFDNAPRAVSYGGEAELTWRVSPRLSLRTAAGLLRTRITRTLDPDDEILGKEFARAPRFSAAAAVNWQPWRNVRLSAQMRHNSAYFSDDSETAGRRADAATIVDLNASLERGNVRVFSYVRNLFDAFALTYLFAPAGNPTALATAIDPREAGAGLEVRF